MVESEEALILVGSGAVRRIARFRGLIKLAGKVQHF